MPLKPIEIIAGGSLVVTGLATMKADKKWIPRVLLLVGIGVLVSALWPSADDSKAGNSHKNILKTSGDASLGVIASGSNVTAAPISIASGATVIGSVGQQGGTTIVNVGNSTGTSTTKLTWAYVSKNTKRGDEKYITTANLHLDSPFPVGALSVVAFGTNVERVTLFPAGQTFVTSFFRDAGKGWASCRLPNAYGNYDLIIESSTPEEFQLSAKIE